MTILHIFPNSLFINPFMHFIHTNYNKDEHKFIVTDIGAHINVEDSFYNIFEIHEVSTFSIKDITKLNKLLKTIHFDKIVIHSAYLNFLLLALIWNKNKLKNAVLVLWGGSDSKPFTVTSDNRKYWFHALIYEKLRRIVYRKVKTIAAVIPADYEVIKKEYNLSAGYKQVKYPVPTITSYLSESLKKKEDNIVRIQVGHSGSPEGNLIEAYDILSRFKNSPIEIYTPLSYGDDKYIDRVTSYGKETFGEKFKPITQLMDGEAFSKFILSMDILVMNTKIQQGLGNLYSYFYAKKKVYLDAQGFLWDFFRTENYEPYDIESLKNVSFANFIETNSEILDNNFKQSKLFFDNTELIQFWNNCFHGG